MINIEKFLKLFFFFDNIFNEINDNKYYIITKKYININISINDNEKYIFIEKIIIAYRFKYNIFKIKFDI